MILRATPCLTVFLLAAATPLVGCSSLAIKYQPATAAAPPPAPRTSVALQVKDVRPADKGGQTALVGQVRSGIGIPYGVSDSKPDVAPRTVGDATNDALSHVGVSVKPGGKTLVASIKEYWMDGYMGYKATILTQYDLLDAAGKPLWSAEVKGESGGTHVFSANDLALKLFRACLIDLAAHATEAFQSPGFQQALAAQ